MARRIHLALLIPVIAAIIPLAAQETRSTIYGRVLDPTASVVAGASVVVTNTGTGTSVTLRTNETGYYEASLLLPGDYRVTVEATGFKRAIRSGLTVPVSSRIEIDFRLDVGNVTESVLVTAAAPLLDTSTASSGWVLDNRSVMELPLLENNALLPIKLTPGIQTAGVNYYAGLQSTGMSSQYTVAGAVGGNEWTIDGAPNNGIYTDVANVAHVDMVQEMKVETSGFDASMGHTTGITVTMMTKAGTNQLHGTATEQHYQNRWQAAPFFTKQTYYRNIAQAEAAGNHTLAEQRRSQPILPGGHTNGYAATIGGPVILPKIFNGRNKLFFFFGFNGSKDEAQELGTNTDITVPTLANRKGDFSQLLNVDTVRYQIYDPLTVRLDPARPGHYIRTPFAGNIIPQARIVNPVYNAYVKFLPTPNNDPLDPKLEPTTNYRAVAMPSILMYKGLTNREDYQHSNQHRFYLRWNWSSFTEDRLDWTYESARGLMNEGNFRTDFNGGFSWVYTPGTRTVLNVTVGANQTGMGNSYPGTRDYKPSDVGLPAYMDAKADYRHQLPYMQFSGYTSVGYNGYFITRGTMMTTRADLTHIRGNHSLQFGADLRDQFRSGTINTDTSGTLSFTNAYTRKNDDTYTPTGNLGFSWAAFMLGIPGSMTMGTNDDYIMSNPFYGWYAQDRWRATRKLSLTFGLRAEYELGRHERYNRAIGWFDPTATLPITAAAQAAYAKSPIPELPASSFSVLGGSVYPGVGGLGDRTNRNNLSWMPRLAAAWQLNSKTVIRGGLGLFYDTTNTLRMTSWRNGPDQAGFSVSTSTTMTNDYGVTWLDGTNPLTDPFPVRANGTRFDAPVRDQAGLLAKAGRGWSYTPFDLYPARQRRWRIGLQRQIGNDMLLDVAYAGSYSDHISISQTLSALPAQYWSTGMTRNDANTSNLTANVANPLYLPNLASLQTSNPVMYQYISTLSFFTSSTIQKNLLLRPFPEMNSITNAGTPLGKARTDELDVYFQKRFSRGFNLNVGYTRTRAQDADFFYNEFDPLPSWRESNNSRPHRLTGTAVWQLPFGKGRALARGRLPNLLFGGWQLTLTYEWQPGSLLSWSNLFYYGDISAIATGDKTLSHWFNTDNFERTSTKTPDTYHLRMFPTRVPNVRADMTNQWNGNLQREFKIKERATFQFRCDILNLQNRSQFSGPSTSPTSTNFGVVTSQTNATNRFLQLQGRIRF